MPLLHFIIVITHKGGICVRKNLIGERLKIARLIQKPSLSQKELIAKLQIYGVEVPDNAISRIESGTRPVTDIELVAFSRILNVSVVWLLGLDPGDHSNIIRFT